MVAARLGWSALARSERVEGYRERWEDVVARRALIVARHRPETIGRTSRTHGACGTVADRAWWPRRRCAVDAGASAGLKEASHMLVRVVVGLVLSRRRVGALSVEARSCWR